MVNYDDDEFAEFMSRVEEVSATIEGLKTGTVDAKSLIFEDEKREREERERAERKARKAEEARAAVEVRKQAAERHERLRDEKKDELEALKRDYYLKKAKRERWEAFRAEQHARAKGGGFHDYYRGWDLFEEDPDEDLFDGDNPAAVQDQAAFDAMAKDVEQRTNKRKAEKEAAAKEKERGNAAFKANQYSEALSAYSRAIEHFRGDKSVYANRALVHIKLRNFLSAEEDASRAIEISTYLDEDASRRPPPPPLLKALVRRATARSELEAWDEAEADLQAALAMAPEAEKPEVLRTAAALRAEREAARREAALSESLKADASGVGGATSDAARVRALLKELQGAAAAAGGPSDESCGAALSALAPLLESTDCRLCLRQAGGLPLLVRLMPAAGGALAESSAALLLRACEERRAQLQVHEAGGTTAVLRALRAAVPLKASPPAGATAPPAGPAPAGCARRITVEEKGSDEKEEEEGGAKGAGAAATPPSLGAPPPLGAGVLRRLASQLSLLGAACRHPRVLEATRALAAPEGCLERLVLLLSLAAPPPGNSRPELDATHAAAASLVGAFACAGKAKAASLVSLALPLSAALVSRLGAPDAPTGVRISCATAVGNLSTAAAYRAELVRAGAVPALLSLLRHAAAARETAATRADAALSGAALAVTGALAEALLPNALAALANLSLVPEAMAAISTPEVGVLLTPWLVFPRASRLLLRRVVAVLAKAANRCAQVVAGVISAPGAVVALTGLVAAAVEGPSPQAGRGAAGAEGAAGAAAGGEGEEKGEEDEDVAVAEELEDGGGGGLVGNVVRLLTACARDAAGPPALCDAGALPLLCALLRAPAHSSSHGNAALAVAECATDPRCLAVLAAQPIIEPLLDLAHRGEGQAMKNAAIALARLAKNARCLEAIRDLHGIEILARAMKGDVVKTMARPV